MRRLFLVVAVIALLVSSGIAYAAPPGDGPPGLAKAIAAQAKHNPVLLSTPGVVGTAVGLGEGGSPVIRVFTERPVVAYVPAFLDGVPVVKQVTGKLIALKVSASRKSTAPVVLIEEPTDGQEFTSTDAIDFLGSATDSRDRDISDSLKWTSSIDGSLGTGARVAATLSVGTHAITASATDSRHKTGRDTVTIIVTGTPQQPVDTTTDLWPRPVPIGVSTGNYQSVSAGTIACRVRDASGKVYALSNVHVYAPNDIDGQSEIGDIVTQPGLYDVANHTYSPDLRLGALAAYKPIDGFIFAFNDIDAAIASTDEETLGNSTPIELGGYGIPSSTIRAAEVNMPVQKFGRTTRLTEGTITGINGTLAVDYGGGWYAWFAGQIVVESSGAFIQPGDSGSLLVTGDPNVNPVGLLFAGNADGTMALANPIDAVLEYFQVVIDGN